MTAILGLARLGLLALLTLTLSHVALKAALAAALGGLLS
ncbi:hypothetical protein J2Z33_002353 [Rubellimicrobium aerolatum]|nr:hypothetical protein [Rubellimicrobium aerolatum]